MEARKHRSSIYVTVIKIQPYVENFMPMNVTGLTPWSHCFASPSDQCSDSSGLNNSTSTVARQCCASEPEKNRDYKS